MHFYEQKRQEWFTRNATPKIEPSDEQEYLDVTLYDLTRAFRGVLRFYREDVSHAIELEGASVDEKIDYITEKITTEGSMAWSDLFRSCRSRVELVCSFLAILELCKMNRIRARQQHAYAEIRLFLVEEDTVPV